MPEWICHARPARLAGRACGHPNRTGGRFAAIIGDRIEVCEACGCTRHAGELRRQREALAIAAPATDEQGRSR